MISVGWCNLEPCEFYIQIALKLFYEWKAKMHITFGLVVRVLWKRERGKNSLEKRKTIAFQLGLLSTFMFLAGVEGIRTVESHNKLTHSTSVYEVTQLTINRIGFLKRNLFNCSRTINLYSYKILMHSLIRWW